MILNICMSIKGANGTGKSTIVCALYLVFNGKVSNLGRSTSIAQVCLQHSHLNHSLWVIDNEAYALYFHTSAC